jgi:hypothetical protein
VKRPRRLVRVVVRQRAPGRAKHLDVPGDKAAAALRRLALRPPDNDNGKSR